MNANEIAKALIIGTLTNALLIAVFLVLWIVIAGVLSMILAFCDIFMDEEGLNNFLNVVMSIIVTHGGLILCAILAIAPHIPEDKKEDTKSYAKKMVAVLLPLLIIQYILVISFGIFIPDGQDIGMYPFTTEWLGILQE